MKKLLSTIALTAAALAAQAQGADTAAKPAGEAPMMVTNTSPVHKLKSNDRVLPRWAIDLNYRYGLLAQTMETIDLKTAYGPNNLSSSRYVQPTFSNGS